MITILLAAFSLYLIITGTYPTINWGSVNNRKVRILGLVTLVIIAGSLAVSSKIRLAATILLFILFLFIFFMPAIISAKQDSSE